MVNDFLSTLRGMAIGRTIHVVRQDYVVMLARLLGADSRTGYRGLLEYLIPLFHYYFTLVPAMAGLECPKDASQFRVLEMESYLPEHILRVRIKFRVEEYSDIKIADQKPDSETNYTQGCLQAPTGHDGDFAIRWRFQPIDHPLMGPWINIPIIEQKSIG